MADYLETTVDKFTFKVPTDRFYTQAGVWARQEAGQVWVGLTDFLQQRSGDVAFAEVKPEGTNLKAGDEMAVIETIKVDTILESPVGGVVVRVNPSMEAGPEIINLDPYGEGWLAVIKVENWDQDLSRLLGPEAYFDIMKRMAEEEMENL
jgi:glycine cleavage system H protein